MNIFDRDALEIPDIISLYVQYMLHMSHMQQNSLEKMNATRCSCCV